MTTSEQLKAYFPENELEWRVQQSGMSKEGKPYAMVLCYVQARAIENRLDNVVGCENWQNEIRVEGENIIARLGVRFGGEWVWKENGASQTDIEAFKGGISGAIKRVASSGFGIGRYLYELDTTFAECSLEKQKGSEWNKAKTKDGKVFYWKTPRIPPQFLPKAEVDTAAEKVDNRAKQMDTSPKQVDNERLFTAEEEKSAKDWAEALDKRAFAATLAELKIQSLQELDYSRRTEFIKKCKENVAELQKLDAADAKGGVSYDEAE